MVNIKLSQNKFCLSRRQTLTLRDRAGVRIDARAGTLWVTQDDDRRDVVLRFGESFTLYARGQAIVQAIAPSRVLLWQPPLPAWRDRVAAWVKCLRDACRRPTSQVA